MLARARSLAIAVVLLLLLIFPRPPADEPPALVPANEPPALLAPADDPIALTSAMCTARLTSVAVVDQTRDSPGVQKVQLFPVLADAIEPFFIDYSDQGFYQWFTGSTLEQAIGAIMFRLLAPTSPYAYVPEQFNVFDFGMNRGVLTLLPAKLGYDVLSVEVMPGCVKQGMTNMVLNDLTAKAHIYNVGGARKDEGELGMSQHNCDAGNSVSRAQPIDGSQSTDAVHVPLMSLSTVAKCNPYGRKIAIFKMDVEGSEADILLGFGVQGFLQLQVQHFVVEVAAHVWRVSFDDGLSFFVELAQHAAGGVYCIDPDPGVGYDCLLEDITDPVFGPLKVVTSMSVAIKRTKAGSCCGNLWFREIQRELVTPSKPPAADSEPSPLVMGAHSGVAVETAAKAAVLVAEPAVSKLSPVDTSSSVAVDTAVPGAEPSAVLKRIVATGANHNHFAPLVGFLQGGC